MLERVKTIVLIILVLNSIHLTGRLWITDHNYEATSDQNLEEITYGEQPATFDQLSPEYIGYIDLKSEQEADEVRLLYETDERFDEAWGIIKNKLKNIKQLDDDIHEKNELTLSSPYIIFRLPNICLPSLFWEDELLQFSFEDGFKDILITYSDEPEILLVNNEKTKGYFLDVNLTEQESDKLLNSLKESNWGRNFDSQLLSQTYKEVTQNYLFDCIKEENNEELLLSSETELLGLIENQSQQIAQTSVSEYVPRPDKKFYPKAVEFESIDHKRLAKAFFLDLSFVRKIEERDGTNIFTDGQRGLRLYPEGAVHYNAPRTEDRNLMRVDYYDLLEQGGHYISLYGGWEEHLRVTELNPSESTREYSSINYRYYHNGVPIMTDKAVEIRLFGNSIVEYRRQVPKTFQRINKDGEMISIDKALQKWLYSELDNKVEEKKLQDFKDITSKLSQNITQLKRTFLGFDLLRENNAYYIEPIWILEFEDGTHEFIPAWKVD
ncbi:two-component system activity regulator YycH [Natranaerobius trueperi]|nr:two-component system activity regulator YycH [Natranaerobius trueperi]